MYTIKAVRRSARTCSPPGQKETRISLCHALFGPSLWLMAAGDVVVGALIFQCDPMVQCFNGKTEVSTWILASVLTTPRQLLTPGACKYAR